MANETVLDTADVFQVNGAVTWYTPAAPTPSTSQNGGLGQAISLSARLAGASEVVIYGFCVNTAGTTIQFNHDDLAFNPVAIVGMLYSTAAVGPVMFPKPVKIKSGGLHIANVSCTTVGGGSAISVYYKKLA